MAIETVLICTVGGSHQPIVKAIKELKPDFTCFVCSEQDPGTLKPGSYQQIEGKGLCIKRNFNDDKPTMPNIPAQCEMAHENYKILKVPADDLDKAVMEIRKELEELRNKNPEAGVFADYTGGTKTMTAALVTAALHTENVDLHLVTGNRADLIKIKDGSETGSLANVDSIRLEHDMKPFLAAWSRYAYDEAVRGLTKVKSPKDRSLASRLDRARDLSRAFAAWDCFDHQEAKRILEIYPAVIYKELGRHLGVIRILADENSNSREPLYIFDLWRNAQRRACQGRYDDAVARCYRLLEWSAQWFLKTGHNIDTGSIKPEQVPPGIEIAPNRKCVLQASLYTAWLIIAEKNDNSNFSIFASQNLDSLNDLLETRNKSIFAHGFNPVSLNDWQKFETWIEKKFLPVMVEETKAFKIHELPPQLPDTYLWKD